MDVEYNRSIVWLRRDLRLRDNVALAEAAKRSRELCVAFTLDPVLLKSQRIGAPIVQAFFDALEELRRSLRERGSDLALLQGDFGDQLLGLAQRTGAQAVFFNEDYDPSAIARDARVSAALQGAGIAVHASLDHVYYGEHELRNEQGEPYKIFTPYRNRWRRKQAEAPRPPVDSETMLEERLLSSDELGRTLDVPAPGAFDRAASDEYPPCRENLGLELLEDFLAPGGAGERYVERRDAPALDGTSHLSVQLRAGTIGIRTCFAQAFEASLRPGGAQIEKWIDELIWREFYQSVLKAFPYVDGAPYVTAAANIPWRNDRPEFARWCRGETGYPIVDAAMTQLNRTGWMHNRLRMLVASFLTKHLLIDWRWGERYFEQHLADADLAQNNGGWQWAASTGMDSAPYFRVFNPVLQSKKFDPNGSFIRSMMPAFAKVPDRYIHSPWLLPPLLQAEYRCIVGDDYPAPIVEHAYARARALDAYGSVLGKKPPLSVAHSRGRAN